MKGKVFVGISGGVDSSVAAYLLKKEGYEVHGIFVKTWSPEWLPCTWVSEKRDAMRVCAALNIPFHFLDAQQAYKDGVATYMINEYKAGRTPNPDVLCNRIIKFGVMWEYAKSHGANYIATGHYAQSIDGGLYKGLDVSKDQSYFLWMLTKKELPHVLFPVGHLPKSDVRSIAARIGLSTATKKDSQGICFLGDIDMQEFLSHYIKEVPGDVVTEEGKIVGEHTGVWFYTLGERHGFTITEKNTERKPYYVIGKDIKKNLLIVGHSPLLQKKKKGAVNVSLREENWQVSPKKGVLYTAQIRYHGTSIPTKVQTKTILKLTYDEVIPLGQSVVIYEGEKVVGGGIIDSVQ